MYRIQCCVISPSLPVATLFRSQLEQSAFVDGIASLAEYPSSEIIGRMLRLGALDFAIVDCEDFTQAAAVMRQIRTEGPNVEIIAVCQEEVRTLSELLRIGVRDYVPCGAPAELARDTIERSIEKLRGRPQSARNGGTIAAFIPGKSGSGASTITANTAMAAARTPAKKTLLLDLDREAPVQAFLHRLHPEHFLQEALANVEDMDRSIWDRLVSLRNALAILPAEADGSAIEGGRMQKLLDFARRHYDLVCVDLPGPLDSPSVEVLFEAKHVFIACTQDLAAVHVTIRTVDRLRRLGLEKEMRILLNRYSREHVMSRERIAGLVNLPVELTLPNDYSAICASVEKGKAVDPASPLGKAYGKLARTLLNERAESAPKERKFLEFLYQPFRKSSYARA
ncbi:MAG: hypothetical protein FJW30_07115 [Acidobacteria bacterium]|nr:hypothetical protein [Acidobacteriota bacterium]